MNFPVRAALLSLTVMTGCHTYSQHTTDTTSHPAITAIAFGSCNHQDKPQVMWDDILAQKPQLWIWLGDNIYGDSEDMEVLREKYERQKANPLYQQLRQSTAIIGIWDDHDYGVNDGGKEYPFREESQQLMMDFLDTPADSPLRSRKGAYSSHTYGPKGQRVKVILLDARYFRDALKKDGKVNLPNPGGDILGEEQWAWLETQLMHSDADVNIIGCGIQFLAQEHPYEKWANFPVSRQRFLDLLGKTKPRGAVLISGDRHIAEISRTHVPGLGYDLHDVTSSGLTHSYHSPGEPNQHRIGELVTKQNYGLLTIDWKSTPLSLTIQIKGDNGDTHLTQIITL